MTFRPSISDLCVSIAMVIALWQAPAFSQTPVPDLNVQAFNADAGPLHAACAYLGAKREGMLKSAGQPDLDELRSRAEQTTEVAAALPGGRSAPSRTRGNAYLDALAKSRNGKSIDDFIFGALGVRGIPPAPLTTDTEFLRRVTLDLTGRVPTRDRVVSFLNDLTPDKRAREIDRLLDSNEFVDRWTMFFGDHFGNERYTTDINLYEHARTAFYLFIKEFVEKRTPLDAMVRTMLGGDGTTDGRVYPTDGYRDLDHYYSVVTDYKNNPIRPSGVTFIARNYDAGGPPLDTSDLATAFTSERLLGLSTVDCLLCHDGTGRLGTLNLWAAGVKRKDAWGMARFFSNTFIRQVAEFILPDGRKLIPPANYLWEPGPQWPYRDYALITATGNRPPRTPNQNGGAMRVTPKFLLGGGVLRNGERDRVGLARMLTADRQFPRAMANYIWNEIFGHGIVDPPENFDPARLDPSNPPPAPWTIQPSHPELLEFLTDNFIRSRFDFRSLLRLIANSRAYQLSSRYDAVWNPTYATYFARHEPRRLQAEVIHDAIFDITGISDSYFVSQNGWIGGTRWLTSSAQQFPGVVDLPGGVSTGATHDFLNAFMRGDRDQSLRSSELTVAQPMALMNAGFVVNSRISRSASSGTLAILLSFPNDQFVRELFLLALGRYPSDREMSVAVSALSQGNRAEAAQDLLWALINKIDFVFNY